MPDAIALPALPDEPLMLHPFVRKVEQQAIDCYRAKYPDAPDWRELDHSTRTMWVAHAEASSAILLNDAGSFCAIRPSTIA